MTLAQGGGGWNQSIEKYSWERSDIGLNIRSWYKYVQRAKRNHLCSFVGTISHQIDISLLKRLWEQCLTKYILIKIETIKKEKINKSLTEKYIYEILIREDKQQAGLDRKRK